MRTKNVVFDDVYIDAVSTNASTLPKNTDGFDSLNVDGLTVTNTRVNVGDDCFSPKPNTTNIFVKYVPATTSTSGLHPSSHWPLC